MNLSPFWISLIVGLCLVACSLMVGIREVLLRPENDRFPKAPLWLRSVLFGYCIVLFLLGSSALFSIEAGHPMVSNGEFIVLLAGGALVHHGSSTLWFLTQRTPRPFRAQMHDLAVVAFGAAHRSHRARRSL